MNCSKCKAKDVSLTYTNSDQLKAKQLCITCDYWMERVENKENPHQVIIKGTMYQIDNEEANGAHFRGFGGRKFHIKFFDGREVESTNLWFNGPIPSLFKDDLPDNAEFVRRTSFVSCNK